MGRYFKELAVNVQHYLDRGYNLAHVLMITVKDKDEVSRVYNIIQEEKKKKVCEPMKLFEFLKKNQNDSEE